MKFIEHFKCSGTVFIVHTYNGVCVCVCSRSMLHPASMHGGQYLNCCRWSICVLNPCNASYAYFIFIWSVYTNINRAKLSWETENSKNSIWFQWHIHTVYVNVVLYRWMRAQYAESCLLYITSPALIEHRFVVVLNGLGTLIQWRLVEDFS